MNIKKVVSATYGIVCYCAFFGTFLYLICFCESIFISKSLDSAPQMNLITAFLIDMGLITLFALQHSGMARTGFKKWLLKTVPAHLERSTYVVITCVALGLLFYFWSPLGGTIWQVDNVFISDILYAISGLGWCIILLSSFLIDHFDLFGLRQVYLYCVDREYTHLDFQTTGLYRYVRHPLMTGFLIAFWATPNMTATHLVFTLAMTVYIILALRSEEEDLVTIYGHLYQEYQQEVGMLLPWFKAKKDLQTTRIN